MLPGAGLRPWRDDVPEHLQLVIEDFQDSYIRAEQDLGGRTADPCFAYLHGRVDDSAAKVYAFDLRQMAAPLPVDIENFNRRVQVDPPPAIFSAYFCLYRDRMVVEALEFFRKALEIGDKPASKIPRDAVDWAEEQTVYIVCSRPRTLVHWVLDVCDRDTDFDEAESWPAHLLELTGGRPWKAPRFLFMEPSIFRSEDYDAERQWERMDARQSSFELERFAHAFVQSVRGAVEDEAKRERLARALGTSANAPAQRVQTAATEFPQLHNEFVAVVAQEGEHNAPRLIASSVELGKPDSRLSQGSESAIVATCGNGVNRSEASWQLVEIFFISDERVQICDGTKTETLNYTEFGFEDGRNGKPNLAWVTLRALAEEGGVIRDAAKTGSNWTTIEKRIQEIREVLRNHFHISADPVPFVKGEGYRAHFKIACRPSFDK